MTRFVPVEIFAVGVNHPCLTGDCVHGRQDECLSDLRMHIADLTFAGSALLHLIGNVLKVAAIARKHAPEDVPPEEKTVACLAGKMLGIPTDRACAICLSFGINPVTGEGKPPRFDDLFQEESEAKGEPE